MKIRHLAALIVLFFSPMLRADINPIMSITATDEVKESGQAKILEGIVRSALSDLGYTTRFVYQPNKRSSFEAEHGAFDGELIRLSIYEQKTQNLVKVPTALYHVTLVAVGLSANLPVAELDNLNDYRMTCLDGSYYTELFCSLGAELIRAKSPGQMVKLIQIQRSQLMVVPKVVAQMLVQNNPDLAMVDPPLIDMDAFFYIHKRHVKLVPELVKRLAFHVEKSGIKSN